MARGVVGRDTGVFAPRLKGGTADGMDRANQRSAISNALINFQGGTKPILPSFVTGGQSTLPAGRFFTNLPTQPAQPPAGGTFQTDYTLIPKEYLEVETGMAKAEAERIDNALIAAEDAAKNRGGVASNPYTDAIRLLQQEIAGGKYGTSYVDAIKLLEQRIAGGRYGTSYDDSIKIIQDQIDSGVYGKPFNRLSNQLSSTGLIAKQDIDAASANAVRALSRRDPMAQYSYEPSTAQIPQAALSNYLTSIGAGTNEVDANRNFLQSMIESENAQAQQYTNAVSQAQNAQRDAAIQGVYGNQAYSQSQLSSAQQAQEFAIKAAREAELKKLTDQILGYTTQEATSKSEGLKTLQDQILGYTAQGETSKAEALRNLQDQILQYSLKGGKTSSKKKGGKK